MARDYYDILGIKEDASDKEIKRVYRELAKKYHPDANRGDSSAEARFKEISEAYSVLSDPQKRKKYDQMRRLGAYGPGTGFNSGGMNFDQFNFEDLGRSWGRGRSTSGGSINIEDLFGSGGFGLGDILGDMFDRGKKTRRDRWGGRSRGDDISMEVSISLETAATGGKQVINVSKKDTCPACKGTGARPGTQPKTCPSCSGRGTISMSQGFFSVNRPCPRCYGRGTIIENPCSSCKGIGEVNVSRKFAINIPAGIEDGTVLRLSGQGAPGSKGGNPGDLLVKIRIKPHHFFKRRNLDLYCDINLDILHAIKGAKVKVKTIHGKKVEMKIPPETRDGTILKLKGMGIKKNSIKGNQYVTIVTTKNGEYTREEEELINKYENNE